MRIPGNPPTRYPVPAQQQGRQDHRGVDGKAPLLPRHPIRNERYGLQPAGWRNRGRLLEVELFRLDENFVIVLYNLVSIFFTFDFRLVSILFIFNILKQLNIYFSV